MSGAPRKRSRLPGAAAPVAMVAMADPVNRLVAGVVQSRPRDVAAVLKQHAVGCSTVLRPQSYGDVPISFEVAPGAPRTCLLSLAVHLATHTKGKKQADAFKIVCMLVEHGADLWGCRDVGVAVKRVVDGYQPGPHGLSFNGIDDVGDDEDALSVVVTGNLPTGQAEGFRYPFAGLLPLHHALLGGSVELVKVLCTEESLNHLRLVFLFLDEVSLFEGQWLSVLAFVTRHLGWRKDGVGLEVLRYLVERMGVSPVCHEPDEPGLGGPECPVLHGLVRSARRGNQDDCAQYQARNVAMLQYLLEKFPVLVGTFDRDCLTAPVLAARRGLTWFVEAVLRFATASKGSRLVADVLNPVEYADPGYQDDDDDVDDFWGVSSTGGNFNPTTLLTSAANTGGFATVLAVLRAVGPRVTKADCCHAGIYVLGLLVEAATDGECSQLAQVLGAFHDLGLPLSDDKTNSPLHVAALRQSVAVVKCIAQFASEHVPEMLTAPNAKGFTPLQVAVKRLDSVTHDFEGSPDGRFGASDDVEACQAAARASVDFLSQATKH